MGTDAQHSVQEKCWRQKDGDEKEVVEVVVQEAVASPASGLDPEFVDPVRGDAEEARRVERVSEGAIAHVLSVRRADRPP